MLQLPLEQNNQIIKDFSEVLHVTVLVAVERV